MKRSAVLLLSSIVGSSMLLGACAAPPRPAPSAAPAAVEEIRAVATFSIIGDVVRAVAGDRVDLFTLVGSDADVHDFEPVPSDSARMAEARLVFENGLELESWLDGLYQSSGSQATRVTLSSGVQVREGGHDHAEEEAHGHEGEAAAGGTPEASHSDDAKQADERDHDGEKADEHGEFDPHVWQSPENMMQMARNVRDALVKADPANAAAYAASADAYIAQLQALDKEIAEMLAQIPAERRKIVTSHDALGYFADRYGLTVVGSVIPALSTEAGDPSAQDIAALVEAIRAEAVTAIFLESMANPRLVERVAQEAGVKIGPELYTDALGAPGSDGGTYIDAMRFNAKALAELLR